MSKSAIKGQGLKYLALAGICVLSFSIRLFSIIKYESVIHEFDPYFNYRVTQFLTKDGFYEWWNWFDDRTWYPLGRVIGGTTYPGLIFTAGIIHNILHFFNIPLHVQEVCVLTAPLFSAFCALASFGLVKEIRGEGAGLLAAAFVGVVPSYISRSVAGSFDNEGVAIFALVNVFQCFIKTVNTGSLFWSMLTVLSYFYMVASWGGYSFIINLLPIYVLACIFTGRLSSRLYIAFVPVVAVGTLMALNIPVVGFNAVLMSEHFGAFFACGVLHAALLVRWVRSTLNEKQFWLAVRMVVLICASVLGVAAVVLITSVIHHPTFGWTGRSLSLLDPTYAGRFIPIIASVSEHQPPSWPSYINDLHILAIVTPFGIMACFYPLTDASLFLVLYGVTAAYFSGVMVRLMLVLAPAVCCLAAVAIHTVLDLVCASMKAPPEVYPPPVEEPAPDAKPEKKADSKKGKKTEIKAKSKKSGSKGTWRPIPFLPAALMLVLSVFALTFYMTHCIWAASDMYSAPSIVLQSQRPDGSLHVFDDFREAYAWLRHNTDPEAKVASWWDYGYQTTAMANRTVVVDNNTWNTTHIATVGRAMSSKEGKAWKIYRFLDVEYVFVVFGGLVGYPSDDINKFLWMVRIGGGVYPEIKESDYLTNGDYTVAQGASPTMLNSLMYKLSYYQFADASQMTFGQRGLDRVRNYQIGKLNVNLKYFEEVFTSQHWMMRIYRVRDAPNRVGSAKRKRRS